MESEIYRLSLDNLRLAKGDVEMESWSWLNLRFRGRQEYVANFQRASDNFGRGQYVTEFGNRGGRMAADKDPF